ncbi:MAG: hypothetical protein ABI376_05820, partial [Caulobacteraceae bacterium]
ARAASAPRHRRTHPPAASRLDDPSTAASRPASGAAWRDYERGMVKYRADRTLYERRLEAYHRARASYEAEFGPRGD